MLILLVAAGIAAALAFPGAGETVDTLPMPAGADHGAPGQIVRLVRVQIEENISVTDTVRALPPASVTVSETVTVSDAVQVPQIVSIVVQESISVVDVASPPAAAAASEAINVSDQVTLRISAQRPVQRQVRVEVREDLIVSDALNAAGATVTPQVPPAVSVIIEEQITVEHPGLDGTPPAAPPTPALLPAVSPAPPARPTPTALPRVSPPPPAPTAIPRVLDPVPAPPSAADGEGPPDPAQPVQPTLASPPPDSPPPEPGPGIPADSGAEQALEGAQPLDGAPPEPAPGVSSVTEAPADEAPAGEEAPAGPLTGPGGGCGFMGPLGGVSLEPALLLGFIGMLLFVRRLGRGAGRPPGPVEDEPSMAGQTEE